MERLSIPPRDDWRETAEGLGFTFHTQYDKPYWVEDAAYAFTLDQIERDLEAPTAELWRMCLAVVDRAARDAEVLASMAIPKAWWGEVRASWLRRDRDLYARFDLSYDGHGPAKMLALNGDGPTGLYESAFFQWLWLEEAKERGLIPRGAGQFNRLQQALIDGIAGLSDDDGLILHLASSRDSDEDMGTVLYLRDCAHQAGLAAEIIAIEDIGVDAAGRLTDLQDRVIESLFKLYPWEFLITETYGAHLKGPRAPRLIEPAWKLVLSNKGLLPWLWRLFPGHPNLLPAFFDGDPGTTALAPCHVRKPLYSREGANVEIIDPAGRVKTDGPYGVEGYVLQNLAPLPVFTGDDGTANHAMVGSWVMAGRACGIGMREDDGPITVNTSRFVPHLIR
ncbi:MAG TPA: glutathionylspermidine synthase family protein [Azospirillaceae bacterium]|nr:glutathionylspermidine synthase family protein [Azospirillaceae bacterium]